MTLCSIHSQSYLIRRCFLTSARARTHYRPDSADHTITVSLMEGRDLIE